MNNFENHPNYNCEITLDTGETYRVFADWIHNEDLDHWQNWHCEAGNTRFYIDKNFDVWSGMCKNDYLGNALDTWDPKSDVLCKRSRCSSCTDDLMVGKHE